MICVPIDDGDTDNGGHDAGDSRGVVNKPDDTSLTDRGPKQLHQLKVPKLPEHASISSSTEEISTVSPHSLSIMKEIVKNTRSHAAMPDTEELECLPCSHFR